MLNSFLNVFTGVHTVKSTSTVSNTKPRDINVLMGLVIKLRDDNGEAIALMIKNKAINAHEIMNNHLPLICHAIADNRRNTVTALLALDELNTTTIYELPPLNHSLSMIWIGANAKYATPLQCAVHSNRPDMVSILLASPKIELDKENPILDEVGCDIDITPILERYLDIIISNKELMRGKEEILHSLQSHSRKLWALLFKRITANGTLLQTKFIDLLKEILNSANDKATEQHPLYNLFLNDNLQINSQKSLFCSLPCVFNLQTEDPILKKIEKILEHNGAVLSITNAR